jgi:HME family heavy-metal exporter
MFRAIVGFSLRHRVFVLLAACGLMVWGAVLAPSVPIDLLPELRPPAVVILTEAGSLATEEVEQFITTPLEQVLNGMPGVKRVRSATSSALSIITVQFDWGSDPYRNRQVVNERLALVRDRLPPGVVPQLSPMSSSTGMIMILGITGGADAMVTREFVDWVVRPRLLALEGVAQVYPVGGEVKTFRFAPDPVAMRSLDIGLHQIEQTLAAFGSNSSGGFSDVYGTELAIRNIGKSDRLEDMGNLVVAYRAGNPVLLSQVGRAALAPRIKRGDGAFDGAPSVNLAIQKQPQGNTVRISQDVHRVLHALQGVAPAGVRLDATAYDQADMIREAVGNVGAMSRDGAIIVAIVLILFLGNVRSTIVSLLAIPVSLVVTIIVFHVLGMTLNTMTLGGIAIALGELVDDSVVDVENILRRWGEEQQRANPTPFLQVIARASQEVRSGIVYATVIILLVFVPLFFLPEEQGRMFGPLALAYIASIFASLLVSITLTPVLASFLFPGMRQSDHGHGGAFGRWLKRHNEAVLRWVLDHPAPALGAAGLAVFCALASIPALPRSFLPDFNEGNVYVTMLLKPGLSLPESYRIGHLAEQVLKQVPEVVAISRRAGRFEMDEDGDPVNDNEMTLKVSLDKGRGRHAVTEDIRRAMAVFSADVEVTQFLISRMQSADSGVKGDVVLKIFGEDLAALRLAAAGLRRQFATIPGLADLRVEQMVEIPQLRITVDYARARLFGITPAVITQTLEGFSNGHKVSEVIDHGRRFDVVLRLGDADRTPQALAQLRLETPAGAIPLSAFATVSTNLGPNQILREGGVRRIAVMANINGGDVGGVVARMREIIAADRLPAGLTTSLEGSFRKGEEGRLLMSLLIPVSILLIFLVLHQRFGSAVLCLIIMGNIPLALVGSVAALWISGLDLSLAAMIGFISVTGVAVRNSLLKVSHFINLTLNEGMSSSRAVVLRGSAERLIPVLMTALAAGLALMPLLVASDRAGTEILHPVAVAIFGGLISSTLLDIYTTPLLFELFGDRQVAHLRTIAGIAAESY